MVKEKVTKEKDLLFASLFLFAFTKSEYITDNILKLQKISAILFQNQVLHLCIYIQNKKPVQVSEFLFLSKYFYIED